MKLLILFAMLLLSPIAHAQTAEQLKRENAELKARLAQQEKPSTQPLAITIQSVRNQEKTSGASHLIITLQIRNQTNEPIALNYLGRSISLVDNYGNSYSPTQNYGKIHGIPVATETLADATPNLPPGGTITMVIDATKYLKNGERMGSEFDLNLMLGQFVATAPGKIRKVRDYPVSFQRQPIKGDAATNTVVDGVVDSLLRKLK